LADWAKNQKKRDEEEKVNIVVLVVFAFKLEANHVL
jgi:hypothetical protein